MPYMRMIHEEDPRDVLRNRLGALDHIDLFHNQVLVAIYERPAQTQGGIMLPDKYRDEEKTQGKAGLIVKIGPRAFAPSEDWNWPEGMGVGDWVFYRASDGWSVTINGVLCRIHQDTSIRGRINHPDDVW